jgi:3-deoxy-D-manno-octulosonic-acid transferase
LRSDADRIIGAAGGDVAPPGTGTVVDRLPLSLRVYRRLTGAATPLAPLLLRRRLARGKELAERVQERRGESTLVKSPGPLIWAHGASVGEMLALIPLITRINARGFPVLATSGTVTSAKLALERLPPGAVHQFIPVDAPRFVARFLDHWRPDLALFAESDLWPNLILAAAGRGTPLILVNGRLSERSFRRWRQAPATIGALLSRFDLCLAQSADAAERYAALGAPRVSLVGNLKFDVPAPPVDAARLAALRDALGDRPVLAAASTHPGEEALLVEAHRRLRQNFPGLITLIAPRHPERGPGIAEIARAARLPAVLRSAGRLPEPDTEIYVADTIGELGLIYRMAPIVFIGGSLIRHGGQNPIEAAKLGAAVLHGPNVGNFSEIYGTLDAAGGAEEVGDVNRLAARFSALLTDAAARRALAEAGRRTVEGLGGALERTLSALDPYLMQLKLQR